MVMLAGLRRERLSLCVFAMGFQMFHIIADALGVDIRKKYFSEIGEHGLQNVRAELIRGGAAIFL